MWATTISGAALALSLVSLYFTWRVQRTRVTVQPMIRQRRLSDDWRAEIRVVNRSAHEVRLAELELRCPYRSGGITTLVPGPADVQLTIPARGSKHVDFSPLHVGSFSPVRQLLPSVPCIAWAELEDGTRVVSRPGFELREGLGRFRFVSRRTGVPVETPETGPIVVPIFFRMRQPRALLHRLWHWRLYTAATGPYPADWLPAGRRWFRRKVLRQPFG